MKIYVSNIHRMMLKTQVKSGIYHRHAFLTGTFGFQGGLVTHGFLYSSGLFYAGFDIDAGEFFDAYADYEVTYDPRIAMS